MAAPRAAAMVRPLEQPMSGGAGAAPRACRRVAFVHLDLGDGGAQRQALLLARHLDPGRYRPLIACLRGHGALVAPARGAGLDVLVLGRLGQPWDLGAATVLARALRRRGTEIVQVPRYSRVVPYAALAARLAGVRLLVVHDHARYAAPPPARRVADALLLRRARYVAVAEALAESLGAEGIAPERIAVVPPGIERARFAAGSADAGRGAIGAPPHALVALVPARLDPMKGHADLIAAAARLADRWPTLVIALAGDGPMRAPLEALAAATGLAGRIRFLGVRADMADLLAACDLVVLPSRVEGMPAALIEAASAGRAVVATAVGGVPELVADGRTGWLVPPRDPAALAAALEDALSDPAERARRGTSARDEAARFAIEAVAAQLAGTWERWLAASADG
jgi:glycosyltransferase involved in cell wall biosynthesis